MVSFLLRKFLFSIITITNTSNGTIISKLLTCSVTFLTMLATFPVHPLLLSNEENFALVLLTTNREGYAFVFPIDLGSIT